MAYQFSYKPEDLREAFAAATVTTTGRKRFTRRLIGWIIFALCAIFGISMLVPLSGTTTTRRMRTTASDFVPGI
jgi:hypothetical protein